VASEVVPSLPLPYKLAGITLQNYMEYQHKRYNAHLNAIRALKPTRLKKFKHTITRSMIHNLPLKEQNDVIKQVKSLGSRLQ
jgi:hypothetical protein